MSSDLLCGEIPIQDSSIKDELVLYVEIPIQNPSLKDVLVLIRLLQSLLMDIEAYL